jgi:hypothetical protein
VPQIDSNFSDGKNAREVAGELFIKTDYFAGQAGAGKGSVMPWSNAGSCGMRRIASCIGFTGMGVSGMAQSLLDRGKGSARPMSMGGPVARGAFGMISSVPFEAG